MGATMGAGRAALVVVSAIDEVVVGTAVVAVVAGVVVVAAVVGGVVVVAAGARVDVGTDVVAATLGWAA